MKFFKDFFGNLSDLQKRILFTLGALIVYRIGSFIPLPGVNASAVLHLFTGDNGMMGMFDMFSGGSLGAGAEHLSVYFRVHRFAIVDRNQQIFG